MKPREPRRKVLIQARMRCGVSWSDACILNLSSRGMLVHAQSAPSLGSYLEIRRGPYVIIARVVWTNANRFGVMTQDLVPADGLIRAPDQAAAVPGEERFVERRVETRPKACRHEASRWQARALEFGTIAILGILATILAVDMVHELLAKPLAAVGTVLDG